jgi:hypothetical protein
MQKGENRKLKPGMSVSLNNIPVVTVTESETLRPGEEVPDIRGSQSHPCSPRYKRRAFTTTIAGTKYIIGKASINVTGCLIKFVVTDCLFNF